MARKIEEVAIIIRAFEKTRMSGKLNMFDVFGVTRAMNQILTGQDRVTNTEVEEMLMRFMVDDSIYKKALDAASA